ncbi:MAG: Hsp20/alpha crystallin family protein [Phycisphaeraceae bacterium]
MIKTARRTSSRNTTVRQLTIQLTHQKFGDFCPTDTWAPQVNLYQLRDSIVVCVDLAGVDPEQMEVSIEPGRLTVSGYRAAPEPLLEEGEPLRIVTMEIDHGRYCRSIALPANVDVRRADSEYKAGLLWVRLPVKRGRSG